MSQEELTMFKSYCKEVEYFNYYDNDILRIRSEIYNRINKHRELMGNLLKFLLVFSFPSLMLYFCNTLDGNNGLFVLSLLGFIFGTIGTIIYFFSFFLDQIKSYYYDSHFLNRYNIRDSIFSVKIWNSNYEKRKKIFRKTESIITTKRNLDILNGCSLDLNSDELVILNYLIEKDNKIRNQYIKEVEIREDFDISVS